MRRSSVGKRALNSLRVITHPFFVVDNAADNARQCSITALAQGARLDATLATLFPEHSRSSLKKQITQGLVRLNNAVVSDPARKVAAQDVLTWQPIPTPPLTHTASPMALNIVFEDEAVLVLNKPVDTVVHPGAGRADGTLLNGLLHYDPALYKVPRAGIVHRLDKDTSGLMVVAKTERAYHALVRELKARSVTRAYDAVVKGLLTGGGVMDGAIARHPTQRTKMRVVRYAPSATYQADPHDAPSIRHKGSHTTARAAKTEYRVLVRFAHFTYVRAMLHTGRTHQIRVHFADKGHPLVGDRTYGFMAAGLPAITDEVRQMMAAYPYQALYAKRLAFAHPITGETLQFECAPPARFAELIACLRAYDAWEF